MHRLAITVALAGALCPAALADVLVVRQFGAGFQEIQPAVDAAADGDLILVKPSLDPSFRYAAFQVVGKSLTLLGEPADGLPVRVEQAWIRDLPAGGRVVLSSLDVRPEPGQVSGSVFPELGVAIHLESCEGSVRVEDCHAVGATGDGWHRSALYALLCDDVAIARCTLVGSPGDAVGSSPFVEWGGMGLKLFQSTVLVADTVLLGSDGGIGCEDGPCVGGDAGSGVWTEESAVTLLGCTVSGGVGGAGPAGVGEDASPVEDVSEWLFGFTASDIRVRDCALDAPPGVVPVLGDFLAYPEPFGRFAADTLEPLTTVSFAFEGEPGQLVTLWVGLSPALLPLGAYQGVFTVGAPFLAGGGVALGTIGGNGSLVVPIGVPALPGLEHLTFPSQAVFAGDAVTLGAHAELIYLDQG